MPLSTPVIEIVGRDAVSVDVSASILEAIRILAEGRFHHLPVVDGKRLAGILSTVDLLKLSGDVMSADDTQRPALLAGRTRIADIMVAEVIPVSPRATVEDAAALLSTGQFHALPIMAATGELVGIVTTTDLIRHMLGEADTAQLAASDTAKLQALEKVCESAQALLETNLSAAARDALEQAIHEVNWAA